MAKKTTKKKAIKKNVPKRSVNKTAEIKKALAATPNKSPKAISAALKAKGVDASPGYVSTIKTNLKAEAEASPVRATTKKVAPKKVAIKSKASKTKVRTKKKAAKKKVTRKKQVPEAVPATGITVEQLRLAKAVAQQLGGIAKAKDVLSALAELNA